MAVYVSRGAGSCVSGAPRDRDERYTSGDLHRDVRMPQRVHLTKGTILGTLNGTLRSCSTVNPAKDAEDIQHIVPYRANYAKY